ncbi:hypothetical protein [Enterococcus sp. CSURQ0835]|uniref:hypothetical protein n=1 Tax=Enterococcus sp. CSURQ0835 TaxID=2681394 RepID=UPI001357AE78|nr:hypothetical protein [Enterococcus sp. CSURQ0835]
MIKKDFSKAHFPAYDDAKGVKLNLNQPKRDLFGGRDDFLTEHSFTKEARQVLDRKKSQPTTGRRSIRTEGVTRQAERLDHRQAEHRPTAQASHTSKVARPVTKRSVVDFAKSTRPTRSGTPFAPTRVPKSLIPEKVEQVSANEILAGLHKTPTSYLLFTTAEEVPKPKKNHSTQRLERSLSGIMEENTLAESKYFKDK